MLKIHRGNMKKLALLILLASQLNYAQERQSEIVKWTEVLPQRGYILSLDLWNEKMCSKIWSKQIAEFKRHNQEVKDPDLILVNQKIMVQDCRVEIKPVAVQVPPVFEAPVVAETMTETKGPGRFLEVLAGGSVIDAKDDNLARSGYSLGARIGTELALSEQSFLDLAVGGLFNSSKTSGGFGQYQINSFVGTLEGAVDFSLDQDWQLGPKLTVLASDKDISLSQKDNGQRIGLYGGGNLLYRFNPDLSMELEVLQRLDQSPELNLLSNLGLRIGF